MMLSFDGYGLLDAGTPTDKSVTPPHRRTDPDILECLVMSIQPPESYGYQYSLITLMTFDGHFTGLSPRGH